MRRPCTSFVACATAMLLAAGAAASPSCAPLAPGAKILTQPRATAIDPRWAPPVVIGMAWSLFGVRRVGRGRDGNNYLSGYLVSPRGGREPRRVFLLARDWTCR